VFNPASYRISASGDFVTAKVITVTFDGAGGTPASQVKTALSGTMVGAISGVIEPTRAGGYFAGWYDGSTKKMFTDILYDDVTLTAKWSATPVTWHTIFANASAGARISPSGMIRVMDGDVASFTFSSASGYNISSVMVDGVPLSAADVASGSYVFNRVNSDHSIVVSSATAGGTNPDDEEKESPNPEDPRDVTTDDKGILSKDNWWLWASLLALLIILALLVAFLLLRSGLFLTIMMNGEGASGASVTYAVEKDGETKNGIKSANSKGKCRIAAKKDSTITISMVARDGNVAVGLPAIVVMEHRREYLKLKLE
jgi:uncharacterized repeat protein (TIGR02543 family)